MSTPTTTHWSSAPANNRWSAVGPNYEPGMPIGWGATESDAIEDLHEGCDHDWQIDKYEGCKGVPDVRRYQRHHLRPARRLLAR